MLVGLFFGSFNPIHTGHLIIATHIINNTNLDEIWFVVSPQNPFKSSASLLNQQHRLNLIKTAIEGEQKIKASNIEFCLPKPSFTIDTLQYLKEKYPQDVFSIILGSDGLQNFTNWKNYQSILKSSSIYVYPRPGFDIKFIQGATIHKLKAPLLDISSTYIRELIRGKKNIRYLVPDKVKEEIERNGYYSSKLENPTKQ
ncbi:MAG: nicotinate (nicotinamide) nucleotide adenylyltransferase [Ferruginibacter sp.]